MVLEEWKHEVQKIEEKLKAFEKKYLDRCKDFKVCRKENNFRRRICEALEILCYRGF